MAARPPIKHVVPQTDGADLGARHTALFRLRNTPFIRILNRAIHRLSGEHRSNPTHASTARLNALIQLNGAWMGTRAWYSQLRIFKPALLGDALSRGEDLASFDPYPFVEGRAMPMAMGADLHNKRLLAVVAGGIGDGVMFSQVIRSLIEEKDCRVDIANTGRTMNVALLQKLFPEALVHTLPMPAKAVLPYHGILPMGMYNVLYGETFDAYVRRCFDVKLRAHGFPEDEDTEWEVLNRLKHRHEVDPTTDPVIFIQPQCRALKNYAHMEEVADKLVARGHKVALIGAGHESATRDRVGKLANLCGMPLWDTILAMKHAALVITPDSVFMHVAGAYQKPALALYGPTPVYWSFHYAQTTSIYYSATCRWHPCWVPVEIAPPCGKFRDPACIAQIPADDIVRYAEEKLNGTLSARTIDIPCIPREVVVHDMRDNATPVMLRARVGGELA